MKAHTIRGHVTFNQWVTGSNPVRLTTEINDLEGFRAGCVFVQRDNQRDA